MMTTIWGNMTYGEMMKKKAKKILHQSEVRIIQNQELRTNQGQEVDQGLEREGDQDTLDHVQGIFELEYEFIF